MSRTEILWVVMGRRPRGGLHGDNSRPRAPALIGRENGRTLDDITVWPPRAHPVVVTVSRLYLDR
jgi:hypothetical protein